MKITKRRRKRYGGSLGGDIFIFVVLVLLGLFMLFPIYNTMQKMDRSLIEAAQDLGANQWQVFRDVVLPLSMPGIYSGIVMVFLPTVSTFAVAELLTMNNIKLFGTTIQENINSGVMLNYGAALSLILLILICATSFFGDKNQKEGGQS